MEAADFDIGIIDGDGGRAVREQEGNGGVAQVDKEGLKAFGNHIVQDFHGEGLRIVCSTRREGKSTAGGSVVFTGSGRPVGSRKIDRDGILVAIHAMDGEGDRRRSIGGFIDTDACHLEGDGPQGVRSARGNLCTGGDALVDKLPVLTGGVLQRQLGGFDFAVVPGTNAIGSQIPLTASDGVGGDVTIVAAGLVDPCPWSFEGEGAVAVAAAALDDTDAVDQLGTIREPIDDVDAVVAQCQRRIVLIKPDGVVVRALYNRFRTTDQRVGL